MGAWGVKPMGNDTAADWTAEHVAKPLDDALEQTWPGFLHGNLWRVTCGGNEDPETSTPRQDPGDVTAPSLEFWLLRAAAR